MALKVQETEAALEAMRMRVKNEESRDAMEVTADEAEVLAQDVQIKALEADGTKKAMRRYRHITEDLLEIMASGVDVLEASEAMDSGVDFSEGPEEMSFPVKDYGLGATRHDEVANVVETVKDYALGAIRMHEEPSNADLYQPQDELLQREQSEIDEDESIEEKAFCALLNMLDEVGPKKLSKEILNLEVTTLYRLNRLVDLVYDKAVDEEQQPF
ncbi:hypothetical protein HK101_009342 [Irineochytrium annulatum]|nr:hypothetical protein HK101_009342 [Irineochytrium annulatum]